jgi:hypothetical protein
MCNDLLSKTTARTQSTPLSARSGSPSGTWCCITASCASSPTPALDNVPVSPVLHAARRRTKPLLHDLWGVDVVLPAAKRGPDPRQEVVQVRGDETSELGKRRLMAIDDKGHEEQGKGQVLRVKIDDEERHGARRVVLGEGIRVGEGEGGEESVRVQDAACGCLYVDCQHESSPQEDHQMEDDAKVCREPTPPSEMGSIRKAFSSDNPTMPAHPTVPLIDCE